MAEKVAFLKEMDEKLDQPGVFQRISEMMFMRKQIIFVDSEGSEIEKTITEVFPSLQVTGQDAQGVMHERKFRPGRWATAAVGRASTGSCSARTPPASSRN